MKPLLLGYLNVRVDAPRETMVRGQRALTDFARREGFCLGTVFVERDLDRPLSALVSLIAAANRDDVRVVAVATASDLGSMPRVRQLTRQWLEREAGARVIVVGAAT